MAACASPAAAMTLPRLSRSASACLAIARFISWGRPMSLTSTAVTSMPHGSVPWSMMSRTTRLICSRSTRISSNSDCPMTLRNVVCASWLVAK